MPLYLRGSVGLEILEPFFSECIRMTRNDFLFFESYDNKKYTSSSSNLFKSIKYMKVPFDVSKVSAMNIDTCINIMSMKDEFIFLEAEFFDNLNSKNNYKFFYVWKGQEFKREAGG